METVIDLGLIIAVVVGLVQVAKKTGLTKRLLPIFAIVLGIIFAFILGFGSLSYGDLIIQGVIVGLSASGLWSGTKAVVKG